jgi:hypothetical protein
LRIAIAKKIMSEKRYAMPPFVKKLLLLTAENAPVVANPKSCSWNLTTPETMDAPTERNWGVVQRYSTHGLKRTNGQKKIISFFVQTATKVKIETEEYAHTN